MLAVPVVPCLAAGVTTPRSASQRNTTVSATTLRFQVQARFALLNGRDGTPSAGQTFNATVYAKGPRARIETRVAQRPLLLLLSPPYVYRLLPQARSGVRYRVTNSAVGAPRTVNPFNLAALLRDPTALRSSLKSGGGRLTGIQVVDGQPLEVWSADHFSGQSAQVKAWLRPVDALPTRLQVKARTFELSASWRDYRRGVALLDSLFAVPAGFRVREAQDTLAPL